MIEFSDYHMLVFCCEHVFRHERSVLYVCREDGDWQFLCGQGDHAKTRDPMVVGVGHLIEWDPSLRALSDLPANFEAERGYQGDGWIRTPIDSGH